MVGDTIGDFIIQLKNAGLVQKQQVNTPYSKLREAIARKLQETGYVGEVEVIGEGTNKQLCVTLKYEDNSHIIRGVKRMSKPGRRVYTKVSDIYPVKFGTGLMILSTPAGLLTGEEARAQHVGGEKLFIIW